MNPIIKMFFYSLYFPLENQFDFLIFGVGSINDILYLHEYDHLGETILLNLTTEAIKVLLLSQVELIELSILDDATIFFSRE